MGKIRKSIQLGGSMRSGFAGSVESGELIRNFGTGFYLDSCMSNLVEDLWLLRLVHLAYCIHLSLEGLP